MTKTYLKFRIRITILAGLIFVCWAGLCLRLFQIQILNGEQYQKIVVKQAQKKQTLAANRGNIFDRENRPLTRNIIHYTLSINPKKVKNKYEIAKAISERTGRSIDQYIEKLNSKSNFEYLERNLQRETLGSLETSTFEGLKIDKKYRRYYPHNQIAAQLLGFTNVDNEGIAGIEKDFNSYLKGEPGWVHKTKGWKGKIQHKSGMPYKSPNDGCNIQLTIDLEYQSILEEELDRRQIQTNAISATGIIINPQNGEILAMASTPGFDNNKYSNSSPDNHRIKSITDQFEPGSTYKIVSAVSALLDTSFNFKDEYNCQSGEMDYYGIPIRDHEPHVNLTLSQIIRYSSNIGIIKVMEQVGAKQLFNTGREFGFGAPTGLSLAGESSGKISSLDKWSAVSLGQIAMGHEVGVTAIQLARAYSAIANGGYLVTPRIIRQIMDHKKNIVYLEEPTVIRKIADQNIMALMRNILRDVVENGTGYKAEIQGWDIAGKTGTAQKWKNGKYSNDKFISNFVGFFPYEDPQLLAVIILDEPNQPYHWGSEGAAIAFKRIVERIINMDDKIIPPSRNKNSHEYKYTDYANNLKISNEKLVNSNLPLGLSTIAKFKNKVEMPELRGFSMRKAMSVLHDSELKYNIRGNGVVAWQSPTPGTILKKGSVCTIGLK